MMSALHGHYALNEIQRLGVVFPPNCRRLVVDFPVNGLVTLNFQTIASQKDLDIITDVLLNPKKHIDGFQTIEVQEQSNPT